MQKATISELRNRINFQELNRVVNDIKLHDLPNFFKVIAYGDISKPDILHIISTEGYDYYEENYGIVYDITDEAIKLSL